MKRTKIIAEGNIFGNIDEDEFFIKQKNKKEGVFKRFEYLSIPFSILKKEELFQKIIQRAKNNNTSFEKEIEKDSKAKKIIEQVIKHMEEKPRFTNQILDMTLQKIYLTDKAIDNILNQTKTYNTNRELAKTLISWELLSDFYCIEGLVGGDGKNNPFNKGGKKSLVSGGLDALETKLYSLKEQMDENSWKKITLKLSSIIERSYKQIDEATETLGIVFGKENKLSNKEIINSNQLIDDIRKTTLQTNSDIGSFYNALIRFHNWMPSKLKINDMKGDTYDSIGTPIKKILNKTKNKKILESISSIKDATSPKGLGLITLLENEKIGNKEKFEVEQQKQKQKIKEELKKELKKYEIINLEDNLFYSGMCGGKWKGIKLLYDTKEALNLNYKIPKSKVITTNAIERILNENNILDDIYNNIFEMNEKTRTNIENKIENISMNEVELEDMPENIIARSSMYGEDGSTNFAGTYESISTKKENIETAIKKVMKSYFSEEAIKSREEIGLAHIPGINIVIQEFIKGSGGVIHISDKETRISYASSPEIAVNGNGNTEKIGKNIEHALQGTFLANNINDVKQLYELFGPLDLEYVIKEKDVYLTQLRPLHILPEEISKIDKNAKRKTIKHINELKNQNLEHSCVIRMEFLGRENIMDKEGEIMNYIRKNRKYILGIEGHMTNTPHIPNKINSQFKIPYQKISE
ncbi:hypothetical protein K9L97_05715 [Candidatus Woesearchaeota archaeon]|nr:hypothetical protein [Candidatus Woesearchaeota archaeon]